MCPNAEAFYAEQLSLPMFPDLTDDQVDRVIETLLGILEVTRVAVITQARTTSTRLPRKVLIEVGGKTLLDHHLDRLATSGLEVLVATTVNAADDTLVDIARARGLGVCRGSENDVLARFSECAKAHEVDVVVRVTSDCPLIDGQVLAAAVDEFLAAGDSHLYLSNTLERTYPRGFDFEIFTRQALVEADQQASSPAEREHVTPYLYANRNGQMTLRQVTRPTDESGYRVTLDTADDLEAIRQLIEQHDAAALGVEEIITLLDEHPEIVALNSHVEQKKLGR